MPLGKDGRNYPDRKGAASPSWKSGLSDSGNGGLYQVAHGHPNADERGRVYQHIIIAETALGKFLTGKIEVHHVNENRKDNSNTNLVICEDHAYHMLLHRRARALKACGNVHWYKCKYCKVWDAPSNMYVNLRRMEGPDTRHPSCHAEAMRNRKKGRTF